MDARAWRRLEPLIDRALELEPEERPAFLFELRATDPELHDAVEAFLRGEAGSRGFLEGGVDRLAPALLHALAADAPKTEVTPLEGQAVGPYRILRELGQGGMGAVFLAERVVGGFEQRVALKLIRLGMDSAEMLARFRAERQILARLEHPHIARLLDGGLGENGQPWFAMEYVDGVALGRYCDERRLGTGERLRLLLQVCDAVEHAHRNLVVHRDLKPSNVLVTREGQVRLLDFGIAKLLEPGGAERGAEAATRTGLAGRALTPQYAAPEQLLGHAITTATDVYALGVVLYELLSGRLPYRLQGLSTGEIERVVCEHAPPPPSAAVLKRADEGEPSVEQASAARGLPPRKLAALLRGDLDHVVGMALRKEPGRRYASVGALADDLRRFLGGRPVSAQRDRFAYRAGKFLRRHRLGVAAAALVLLALAGGLLGIVWQAREALRQARRAEEVKRFTFSLFEISDPDAAQGRQITAQELLERGAARVRSELQAQPELQAEMLLVLGNIYHRLSLDQEGQALRERALELRRGLPGADALAVAEAELAVGGSCLAQEQAKQAELHFARALQLFVRRLGDGHVQAAVARGLLARARFAQGDLAAAEPLLRQALAVLRGAAAPDAEQLTTNLTALGLVLHDKGDLAGAEALYAESLALGRRAFGDEHSQVAGSLFNLAAVMKDRGNLQGAETQYREVLALHRRRLTPPHETLASDLNNLGTTLTALGRYAEAEALLREALTMRERMHGAASPLLAISLHTLAQALRWQGRLGEAEPLSRRALALAAGAMGDEHPNVAAVREELAQVLRLRGALAEAEALAQRALDVARRKLGPEHPRTASALTTLGSVRLAAGRPGEAEPTLREALGARTARFGREDWRTAESGLRLGECLAAEGRRREAEPLLAASRATLIARLGASHPLALEAAQAADDLRAVRR